MRDFASTKKADIATAHYSSAGLIEQRDLLVLSNGHKPHSFVLRKSACACGGGCPSCQSGTSDLKVSEPNDAAEIEADAIADRVMRMPAGAEKRSPTHYIDPTNRIHRKCGAGEQEDDDETVVQRKSLPSAGRVASHNLDHVRDVISSSGRPLDAQTRNCFERRMGYDLSRVRLHTSSAAVESARRLDARAYTLGSDIVFGNNEYNPNSEAGRHLLAHELAHTTQQGAVAETIRRTPDECPDPIPNSWQLYGGDVGGLAHRKLFLTGKMPDLTTINNLSTKGIEHIPELTDRLGEGKLWFDKTQPMDPQECAVGLGIRFTFPAGNSLSLEAIELCQVGDVVKFKFFCGSQPAEKNCSQMTTAELIAAGEFDPASVESEMRAFLAETDPVTGDRETIAIAFACDGDGNKFYYQTASSNAGQMTQAVIDVATKKGVVPTYSEQTNLASDLVRNYPEQLPLTYGAEANIILANLKSRDQMTKEAAQLKVFEAFKEYPNLHAEREAIYAIADKGDKPIYVMPSRPACVICKQFIPQQDVKLLTR